MAAEDSAAEGGLGGGGFGGGGGLGNQGDAAAVVDAYAGRSVVDGGAVDLKDAALVRTDPDRPLRVRDGRRALFPPTPIATAPSRPPTGRPTAATARGGHHGAR